MRTITTLNLESVVQPSTEEQLADLVADAVNAMSFDPARFSVAMLRQHRTLQQSFARLCLAWLYCLADEPYDLRNEAAVSAARAVRVALGPGGDGLPMV